MTFWTGQKVVYVGLSRGKQDPRRLLKKGSIYTVAGKCLQSHDEDEIGIFICEVSPKRDAEWCSCFHPEAFRPLVERKTDISIFKAMLNRVPVNATESAEG